MGGHTPLQNTEAKHFFWVSSKGAPYCHPRSIYVLMIFCGLTGLTMMVHFDMLVNHTSPNGISSKMDMRKSNVFGRTVPGIALVKWRCWCQHAQKCQIPPWKLISDWLKRLVFDRKVRISHDFAMEIQFFPLNHAATPGETRPVSASDVFLRRVVYHVYQAGDLSPS